MSNLFNDNLTGREKNRNGSRVDLWPIEESPFQEKRHGIKERKTLDENGDKTFAFGREKETIIVTENVHKFLEMLSSQKFRKFRLKALSLYILVIVESSHLGNE